MAVQLFQYAKRQFGFFNIIVSNIFAFNPSGNYKYYSFTAMQWNNPDYISVPYDLLNSNVYKWWTNTLSK